VVFLRINKISNFSAEKIKKISDRQMEEIKDRKLDAGRIVEDVKNNGDAAVLKYTEKFDNIRLNIDDVKIDEVEIEEAYDVVPDENIEAIKKAANNIERFHSNFFEGGLRIEEVDQGLILGYMKTPISDVGVYVPGGRAAYPSSALMGIIPGKVAGVENIVVCTPPDKEGNVNPNTLVATDIAGADSVYKVGGVQAIACMAYGTNTIPNVSKIVGPGNTYVTAAKSIVSEDVAIDMLAGPSEVLVIADDKSDPGVVASDLMAQAEHGEDSIVVLISTSKSHVQKVLDLIRKEMDQHARSSIISKTLDKSYFLYGSLDEAICLSNRIAPEHLEILCENRWDVLREIKNAGAIFIGEYSPVAAGDYATGCNHILPTGGLAKVKSGLDTDDFVKRSSIQFLTREGLSNIRKISGRLAKIEGLDSHGKSIFKRFEEE